MSKGKPLSLEEKKFIEMHAAEWTDEKIAQHLKRNIITVSKHRNKVGLKKTQAGKLEIDTKKISKTSINKSNMPEEDKLSAWRAYFKKTQRYKSLHNQLSDHDLVAYVDMWAAYHLQFEDMTASEEDMLDVMITYKLRMDANRRDFKGAEQNEDRLRDLLGGRTEEQLELENEEDRAFFEMLASNNRIKQDLNKDYRELTARYEQLQRSMDATREQRASKNNIGSDTFLSLIEAMTAQDRRESVGKYNELMKLSQENKAKEFKKNHKFVDGSIAPLYLDGSDFVEKKGNK